MEILTTLVTGPVLPATVLLGLMLVWGLFAILGAVELDLIGDLDFGDGGAGGSSEVGGSGDPIGDGTIGGTTGTNVLGGIGLFLMKWLNLRGVPIMLWLAVFSLIWWFTSACLWSLMDVVWTPEPSWLMTTALTLKNLMIALPLTKVATQPMAKWFINEHLSSRSLIGQECHICSLQATSEFGQAKFKTEGAPLLLNVRTDGLHLAKGTRVWIVHYDSKKRIYLVSPTTTDISQTSSLAIEHS
jgi:hypothetical protein